LKWPTKNYYPCPACEKRGRLKDYKSSDFGVSRREGHDSSKFYRHKLYDTAKNTASTDNVENAAPQEHLNKVFCKSSEKMDELPNSSVHFAVISPPYNRGKIYDQELALGEYSQMLKAAFTEVFRALVTGRESASALTV
jgi:hypothetical protein